MNPATEHRRLAAIMFTDMVGYSALAQRSEALALELLEEHRRLLRSLFPRFHGTEIKTIGDAFLVEFGSALEAAQCAIEIQRGLAKRNADAPADRQIQIRIGMHIGDVVHRDGDVYGDGVNIASRIEPLAGPGGICVSVDVERQIRSGLEVGLVKLGPTELKNIQMPMDLFQIVLPWEKPAARSSRSEEAPSEVRVSQGPVPSAATRSRWTPVLAVLAVALVVGVVWWLVRQHGAGASSGKAGGRITSLGVKPLDDFSGDTNQAYLSDGMTEALCAALGNISALRVPGRSSTMRFKGAQKTIQEMARELNVDAIVEGSIQRSGNRILITAQLIEAASDRHLWSTTFERDLGEFFKVQSEVARLIAQEVQVRLTPEDQLRLARARTANREAIEACLLGAHQLGQWSDQGFSAALRHFQKAIESDPSYAPAHAGLAATYGAGGNWGLWPPREAMPKSKLAAQKAIELDPSLPSGHMAMGLVKLYYDWDWRGAENEFRRAMDLSPNSAEVLNAYGEFLTARARFDEAVAMQKKALALEPLSPAYHVNLAWTYHDSGQFAQAMPVLLRALQLDPTYFQGHFLLAWNSLREGKTNQAFAEFKTTIELDPESPLARMGLAYWFAVAGQQSEALRIYAELDELASKRYVMRWAQAAIHVGLGQKEQALDWFEKAYEEREPGMAFLKVDPCTVPLRDEPRFRALLKKVGLDE